MLVGLSSMLASILNTPPCNEDSRLEGGISDPKSSCSRPRLRFCAPAGRRGFPEDMPCRRGELDGLVSIRELRFCTAFLSSPHYVCVGV